MSKPQLDLFGGQPVHASRGPSGAMMSLDERHRYLLWRKLDDEGHGVCTFVMLNPSTADATNDDPTIRSCMRLTRLWGYSTLTVVNLFSWRTSDALDLRAADEDPTGDPKNLLIVIDAVQQSKMAVMAWGSSIRRLGPLRARAAEVEAALREHAPDKLYCLNRNRTGEPTHPLFWRKDRAPIRFLELSL